MKSLVLGIGNTILGDDGFGCRVAQMLSREINDDSVDILEVNIDSLNLLECILGYDRLIVVDAILTEADSIGKICRFRLEDSKEEAQTASSPHHLNLKATVEIGRKLFPDEMPKEVIIYAVGAAEPACVTEEMSDSVRQAIPVVVSLIKDELGITARAKTD